VFFFFVLSAGGGGGGGSSYEERGFAVYMPYISWIGPDMLVPARGKV